MSVMSCNCDKPAPKHKLGVFCTVCKGFIEENNKARTEKIIDDQAKLHPWFEKKTPSFEGKTAPEVKKGDFVWTDDKKTTAKFVEKEDGRFNVVQANCPKDTYQWFDEKDPSVPPIVEGDLRLVTIQAKAVFEWSTKIVDDVDENNKPIAYKSGWIMNVLPQKIVFHNHTSAFLSSTYKDHK